MKIELSINKTGQINKISVLISFINESAEATNLPLERIRINAARSGLAIRDDSGRLEPIEFDIVKPVDNLQEMEVLPSESVDLEVEGEIVKKSENVYGVLFPHATYKVELNKPYDVDFGWGGFRSEPIEFVFEFEST